MALQAASVVSSAFSVPKEVFAFISYFVLRKVSSLLLTPKKLMGLVFLDFFFLRESPVHLSRIQACLGSHSQTI